MSKSFINIEDVSFAYCEEDENSKNVIEGLNLKISEGEFIALLGHNASGKSTIAKLMNATLLPTKGKVFIDGMDTTDESLTYEIRKNVGLVLQNPDNQIVAGVVEEDVAFGPENLAMEPEEIRKRVDSALEAVGMYEHKDKAPHKLSGGQKQRVAIAGVIAMSPKCIILDEPTSMLDPKGREEVLSTIKFLNKEKGITIILITHYMDEAILADRVIVMEKGSIVLDALPRDVFSDTEKMYSLKLAVPQATQLISKLCEKGIVSDGVALSEEECIDKLLNILADKGI